jgi:ribose transport system substrate-binding protein
MKKLAMTTMAGLAAVMLLMSCGGSGGGASSASSGGSAGYASKPAFVGDPNEMYFFISWYAGNEWWVGGYEGFKDAARQLGVKTQCLGAPDDSIDGQIAVLEQALAQSPKGISLAVSDGNAFGSVVQKALESGIPITTTDNKIEEANPLMFMAYDDAAMTKVAADHIGNVIGGRGKVAILEVVGQTNLELRTAAFRANMTRYWPNIRIVGSANSGHDELKGASDTASFLVSNPDLDFIYTLNPTAAMGAVTAIKEAKSKCRVITMDVNENVIEYLKDGSIDAAIMPDSYTFGYLSMIALYCEAHKLLDPMWEVKLGKKSGWSVPTLEVGATVVTGANADNYSTSVYYARRGSKGFEEGAQDMKDPRLPGFWNR